MTSAWTAYCGAHRWNDWNVLEFHTDVFGGKWFYVVCCGWLPWSTT